jgi:hypothetical protein
MKRISLTSRLSALALAAALMGAAVISLAESSQRDAPQPPDPQSRFVIPSDPSGASPASRDFRSLIEDLESSSADDITTGRIGRYFTNPAVIITDGRAHQIYWDRFQGYRGSDRSLSDRNGPDTNRRDRTEPADRGTDTQLENFETHRIDPRTVVVMYTAVLPDADGGVFHQPVCATLVRETSSGPWRVASYTAEDAAIPGSPDPNEGEPLPSR